MMLESEWNQNRNHLLLELESQSWILENPGIGIRIRINLSGIGIGIGITGPAIIYSSGTAGAHGKHLSRQAPTTPLQVH